LEPCSRAAVLIDAAAFFEAVRSAFLAAQRSVIVVGWDIDSRTPLVGAAPPDDGLPTAFGPFLGELINQRPKLQVHLLLWDYSLVYAHEREVLPRLTLDWEMPPQVRLRLDSTVSFGSSQHQKLVIVDDAVAFCGGLDLTVRRWDTGRHQVSEPGRLDPSGKPYKPFHDVQILVDGKAAEALALLARQRWCHAIGKGEPKLDPTGDPWPVDVVPDFTDVEIGIARTQPRFTNEIAAHEVERLFHDCIDRAQRSIYIENQFTTSSGIAQHLSRRLRANRELEVVIVAPHAHESLLESRTMRNGRIRFWRTVQAAGGPRVRLVSPEVATDNASADVMIHSKVMVIDDSILRVGSANLNNRSMGADTECDLAIEAADDRQRMQIAQIRNRLLADHCGARPEEVEAALAANPSLVDLVDTLSRRGHRLKAIDDGALDRGLLSRLAERVADPRRPLRLTRFVGHFLPRILATRSYRGRSKKSGKFRFVSAAIILALLALPFAWQFTGLADYADPDAARAYLAGTVDGPLAPFLVVACFVLGGLIAFPVVVLILVTAALFGPWLGTAYAAAGVAASGVLFYAIGAGVGSAPLKRIAGSRWPRLRGWLQRRGLLAVVALRVLPMAPFTLVNLAIGASGIRFLDFALGTLIGMGPGLVVMCFVGSRIADIIDNPSVHHIAWLLVGAAAWVGAALLAQKVVMRLGGDVMQERT
jgi:phosphatidylserine/phosphatidylglycerophosphate/cardiolipin synthase-like enzyme/uncharacterized membrane protein YdjX (TVP38/TMEM64 family)